MHVRAFGKNYVAERGAGVLWNINRNILTDGGGLISREFSAMLPVRSNQHISELVLDAFTETRGVKISMRQSDNGREWSSFVDREMTNPDYEAVSVWRRLGKSRPPKRLFHFRITDPCAFSINGARVNDGQIR